MVLNISFRENTFLKMSSLETIVQDTPTYYSQFKQDFILNRKYFKNLKNGVFVDVGAHDGITLSNTYFFEKELKWTGLCIEPIPDIFEKLQQNRKCICVNACAYDTMKKVKFDRVKGYSEMLSGIRETYDEKHKERIEKELKQYGGDIETIDVQALPLSYIFEKYGLTHVNYLSIDTEGSELNVLKGIDFSKITVDVIDVENNYNNLGEIFNTLSPYGFVYQGRVSCDEIFARKEFLEKM